MSKLCDAIEAKQLHRVALIEPTMAVVTSEATVSHSFEPAWMYKLGVELSVRGVAATPAQLALLKEDAKRQMIHNVYGEFRPALAKLSRELHGRNWEKAIHALRELELEMFT